MYQDRAQKPLAKRRTITLLTCKPGIAGWPQKFTKAEYFVDGYFAVTIFPGAAHQLLERRVVAD